MLRIAIIIGSTRPGRKGEAVAKWAYEIAQRRRDGEFELVDIKDFNLPLLDEPMPPIMGQYTHDHTKTWSAKIASFDAYVFVTPEYNHATSGALKNAIDFLYVEWVNKVAGFIGYGGVSGARAVENLRLIMGELTNPLGADARNNTTTYTYDNMDRLATRKDALLAIESYQYDGNGNRTQFTDRRNKVTT